MRYALLSWHEELAAVAWNVDRIASVDLDFHGWAALAQDLKAARLTERWRIARDNNYEHECQEDPHGRTVTHYSGLSGPVMILEGSTKTGLSLTSTVH